MRNETTAPPRTVRSASLILAGLTTLFVVFVTFRLGGVAFSNAVDDLGEMVAAFVAVGACALAARRAPRSGWGFLAASALAWGLGEAMWSYEELVRGRAVPFPSWPDAGFLAAVPLAVVGLRRLFPREGAGRTSSVMALVYGLPIGGSVVILGWAAVLVHHAAPTAGLFGSIVGMAYPAGDLVMAVCVLGAARRGLGHADGVVLALVLGGILAFAVADTSFAVLTAVGHFGLGNWMDTGWVLGYFLLALGALWSTGRHPVTSPALTQSLAAEMWGARAALVPAQISSASVGPVALGHPTPHARHRDGYLSIGVAADQIVVGGVVILILADASVVLYDLARILTMLTRG